MTQRRQFIQSTVACAAAAMAPAAFSQAAPWPAKPINYLVAFPPGGTTDILARVVSQKLGTALGTTLVIENKGGAGGSVGSEIAARAPADGYNLLGGTISSHAINVSLYPKLGYDPIKSFTPVYLYGTNPVVLVVAANSPYKTLRDLLTAAKANPGKLSGASAGNGTSQHLAQELLAFKGDVKFTHVPYKGSAPAIQDVMSGQVDFMFDTTVVAGAHIQSGKLRALAVTSGKRLTDTLTEVPTVSESGWPGTAGFEVVSWQALFAPAGTPKPIVDKLHAEILKIIQSPEMQERIKGLGMQPSVLTPEQVQAFQKAEIEKWAQVIKAANIKLE
ncbi:Bug family tripartite tricarboxylate transporter substrate binding protein [Limnohabitans sp.]|jgi:tripartite-type tricarboxylate transporter receptor subunit TctC|uniref:Bug family tripartite tricarboxylate transporter substrate binding protein n=1 Tax=Limnohabitans sp. TaxID=1907725 RepID=UPI0037BF8147